MNNKAIIHPIFPTLLLEEYYEDNENFLEILKDSWQDHCENGYSNELSGNFDIHLDNRYTDLYKYLHKCIVTYLNIVGIDEDIFNINFVKSWFNALGYSQTPAHAHADVHLSVVYYAKTPENHNQFLRLHDNNPNREPCSGIFSHNSKIMNEFNGPSYNLLPKQGQIFIFPSKIVHDTIFLNPTPKIEEPKTYKTEEFMNKRICVASDIVLTYKKKQPKSYGLQPIENWRIFES